MSAGAKSKGRPHTEGGSATEQKRREQKRERSKSKTNEIVKAL